MDVLTAIKERRSVRKFKKLGIEDEKINALKEALIWAPSAGNLQSRRFYFVFNNELKDRLARAALNQSFISESPLAVVACVDLNIMGYYGKRGTELYCIQDCACSIENMMLLAHSLGLGTVWVGAFYEDEVSKALELQPNYKPVAIIPIGYPAYLIQPTNRVKPEEAIVDIR